MTAPLAAPSDVQALWRPLGPTLTTPETNGINNLITIASANLRQVTPFDIDERTALYSTDPTNPMALNPVVVAGVVAERIKSYLNNPAGAASSSDAAGPFSHSATYVNRYDKTGSDVRGSLEFTDSDVDRLRPAVPAPVPSSFTVGIPQPRVLLPNARYGRGAVIDERQAEQFLPPGAL